MPYLTLSAVTKSYGAARALTGVSLRLQSGELHGLMGENGAGKSTLIKVLAGLVRPDAGQVQLNGAPVTITAPAEAGAAGLRFLHQELQVVPGVSVAENMYLGHPLPSRFGLLRWRALHEQSAEALHRLGVTHISPRASMGHLGPGDQMLVRIAATLVQGDPPPWLYVLDEPTAALSGAEAGRLFATLHQLIANGAGVLYVSHRLAEVLALADRISVLRDGAVVASHLRGQVDQTRIIQDMTGRAISALYPPKRGATGKVVLTVAGLAAGPLHRFDLDLRAGEVVGLAGLAGSGRNAALKALIGAVPRRGRVKIDTRPLARTPAGTWVQGVAYVPRERRSEGVMLHRPLAETISLPHLGSLSWAGLVRHRKLRANVMAQADAVALKAAGPAQSVGQLSGGNQQKTLFARALVGKPKVLLLDEPTRGVDVGAKFDIYRLIRELAADGVAVLVASSDLPELIGLCDRIAVLHRGNLMVVLDADGLTEAQLLHACYPDPLP